mmetsp:Transcript_23330/g.79018  ORF Transcript_23330/g.79018 Transcript_23330/m.79018 type:complete len:229 (-) Transcript_23330:939-1625(-)
MRCSTLGRGGTSWASPSSSCGLRSSAAPCSSGTSLSSRLSRTGTGSGPRRTVPSATRSVHCTTPQRREGRGRRPSADSRGGTGSRKQRVRRSRSASLLGSSRRWMRKPSSRPTASRSARCTSALATAPPPSASSARTCCVPSIGCCCWSAGSSSWLLADTASNTAPLSISFVRAWASLRSVSAQGSSLPMLPSIPAAASRPGPPTCTSCTSISATPSTRRPRAWPRAS